MATGLSEAWWGLVKQKVVVQVYKSLCRLLREVDSYYKLYMGFTANMLEDQGKVKAIYRNSMRKFKPGKGEG